MADCLADELRLRGLRPWVDKQGGFLVGDESKKMARHAIRNDCEGLILIATEKSFASPFVTNIEVDEARKISRRDKKFLLIAVPVGLSFEEMRTLSLQTVKMNLSDRHTLSIEPAPGSRAKWANVASEILRRVLSSAQSVEQLTIQLSTREMMPIATGELLTIDGRPAMRGADDWIRFVSALQDVKRQIATNFGRPALVIQGSKHLSTAFLFGRVFQMFELTVRQTTEEYWSLRSTIGNSHGLQASLRIEDAEDLILSISVGAKDLQPGIEATLDQAESLSIIRVGPVHDPVVVAKHTCGEIARWIYSELERAATRVQPKRIHLFCAAPQSLLMCLGQQFKGMPETLVYDWNGQRYEQGRPIPAGVL